MVDIHVYTCIYIYILEYPTVIHPSSASPFEDFQEFYSMMRPQTFAWIETCLLPTIVYGSLDRIMGNHWGVAAGCVCGLALQKNANPR